MSKMYAMLSGMSWKANSSIEKFQNCSEVGEQCMDFLEYLLPRLFPSCEHPIVSSHYPIRQHKPGDLPKHQTPG